MKYPRICQIILWLCFVVSQANASNEPRLYSGSITVPTLGELGMTLGISETDEGTFILLTVPTQGATSVPLNAVYLQNGSITASLPSAQLTFVVMENENQTRLLGHMEQGLKFTIDFERVNAPPTLQRPQNPKGPFPYTQREVTTLHPEGHLLAGTLTIPEGRGPFPCAVLISGSGMQDRDESLMGHKPFLVVADNLTRYGIAVLRFDDRGVGGSIVENPEELKALTTEDFATDVAIMVSAARMNPNIAASRIGVIGHSEGGLIGPMVAVNDERLAFVVMLAGPGVSGYELLPVQQALILQSVGCDSVLIDAVVHAAMSFYESMQAGANDAELRVQMADLVEAQISVAGRDVTDELFETAIDEGLEIMLSPWMRYFLFYDPAPVLAQVKCPILAMNGTLDVQVSSAQNLPAIEQAMIHSKELLTIVELEGLNHLFQFAQTGSISEYGVIETTFEPIALEVMRDWILEVVDVD